VQPPPPWAVFQYFLLEPCVVTTAGQPHDSEIAIELKQVKSLPSLCCLLVCDLDSFVTVPWLAALEGYTDLGRHWFAVWGSRDSTGLLKLKWKQSPKLMKPYTEMGPFLQMQEGLP
jgi:hypothetical protein